MHVCVDVTVQCNPASNVFFSPVGTEATLLTCFFFLFSNRARQKLITKETDMPGESKASRLLRVVHKMGKSLILCLPPPPHVRLELLALP